MKMYGLSHPPLILSQKVPTYALLTFRNTTYVKNMHLHRDSNPFAKGKVVL